MLAKNNKSVLRLSKNQADFVRELVIRNDKLVRTLLKSTLGDLYGRLGDECIGELHLLACSKAAELMTHPNPDGWLIKSCKLKALEQLRKSAAENALPLSQASELAAPADNGDEYKVAVILERLAAREGDALLSPRERQVYRLLYTEDKSTAEAAKLLGVSEKTVLNTRLNMIKKVKRFITENLF